MEAFQIFLRKVFVLEDQHFIIVEDLDSTVMRHDLLSNLSRSDCTSFFSYSSFLIAHVFYLSCSYFLANDMFDFFLYMKGYLLRGRFTYLSRRNDELGVELLFSYHVDCISVVLNEASQLLNRVQLELARHLGFPQFSLLLKILCSLSLKYL